MSMRQDRRSPSGTVRVWSNSEPTLFIDYRRAEDSWKCHVDRLFRAGSLKVSVRAIHGHRSTVVELVLDEAGLPKASNIRERFRNVRSISALNAMTDPCVVEAVAVVSELSDYLKSRASHLEARTP